MENYNEHAKNHYHSLIVELQTAKREGYVYEIQFLDHDLLILMDTKTPDAKIQEVADHISKKYRVYTEAKLSTKTIAVYDVYTLDPRV